MGGGGGGQTDGEPQYTDKLDPEEGIGVETGLLLLRGGHSHVDLGPGHRLPAEGHDRPGGKSGKKGRGDIHYDDGYGDESDDPGGQGRVRVLHQFPQFPLGRVGRHDGVRRLLVPLGYPKFFHHVLSHLNAIVSQINVKGTWKKLSSLRKMSMGTDSGRLTRPPLW